MDNKRHQINPYTQLKGIFNPDSAEHELPSYLNLWAAESSALIGVDGQLSYVYEFQGSDLLLKSEEGIGQFYNSVKTALSVLPENTTVQFVVQVRRSKDSLIDNYRKVVETTDDLSNYLADVNVDFFRNARPYSKRYLMYVTIHPEASDIRGLKPSLLRLIQPDYKKLTKDFHEKYSAQLKQCADVFSKTIAGSGINVRQLETREIIDLLYEHLNPGRSAALDFSGINPEHTLRTQLVFSALENEFSQCTVDGYHFRAVNLYVRPEDVVYTYLPNLIGKLDDEYDIVVTANRVNNEKALEAIISQRTIASMTNLKKNDENYGSTQKVKHITSFVEVVQTAKEALFEMTFCVVLRDKDLSNLKTRADICLSAMRGMSEAEGIIDDMNHFQLYLSVLPNHSMYNVRKHIMHASAVSVFLPLFQYWPGCKTPKMLFFTRQNELLPVDIHERALIQNSNILVFGASGSGKSFTVNTILESLYMIMCHIIVIDIGGSYFNICKIFGGQYFPISFSEEYGLNPFPLKEIAFLKNEKSGEYEMDPDSMAYLSLLTKTMIDKPDMTGQESLIIERAIASTYRHLSPSADAPIISNLFYQLSHYSIKGSPEGAEVPSDADATERRIALKFAKNLEKYTEGAYGRLFNRRTTINVDSRFTVFELQGLREHADIKKLVIFIIRNLIWKKLYDRSIMKFIVFDETWALMKDPLSAALLEDLYRVVRKENGAILAATQNPADITDSPIAGAVKINTSIKFFLRMTEGIEHLSKWDLNQQEVDYIKSLKVMLPNYSEIALKYGEKFRVLRHRVPKPLYWVCTSDPNDYNKHQAMKKKYPNAGTLDIIKKLASGEEVK